MRFDRALILCLLLPLAGCITTHTSSNSLGKPLPQDSKADQAKDAARDHTELGQHYLASGEGPVMGLRARGRAQAANITVPGTAMAGLVIGAISCVTSIALFTYAAIESQNEQDHANKRVAEIDKQLGKKPEAPTLDHDTACLLGEQYTLKNSFDDKWGYLF